MTAIESARSTNPNGIRRLFYGPAGLRSGWRLLIFVAVVEGLIATESLIHRRFPPPSDRLARTCFFQVMTILIVLFASWIMTKIEGRTFADYGLPWRRMFRAPFWQGMALGFASVTALLLAMRVDGVFRFGSLALHGAKVWQWAGLFGVGFFMVAIKEESMLRGYALFALSEGIGFWPAAIFWSVVFGYLHRGNPGETWLGVMNVGLGGLFFCLLLRRTGNLWMAIGFHAAFDWAQTFFYGVPDSGIVLPGHLFNPSISGPAWLSGGTVGPEGSLLCTAMLVILALIVAVWLREAKYPNFNRVISPTDQRGEMAASVRT